MADWPPVAPVHPTPSPQQREETYLMLVDMFVDIVEPEIIQMVLQNRNWDVDAALEDIMMLTNTAQPSPAQNVNKTYNTSKINKAKAKKTTDAVLREENATFNKSPQSHSAGKVLTNPQDSPQSKPKKPVYVQSSQKMVPEIKRENQLQLQPFIEQYNYIKATRSPFDRAVMLINDGVKVMIILRGPPGSGKSTSAKKLLLASGIELSAHKRHIFSTDDFYVQNKVYVFVPELLSQAHLWNQRSVAAAIREEVSPVIVDNTNTQAWEMRVYAEMAVSAGYDLEVLEPDACWLKKGSVNELEKRNIHSVPKAKIRQMLERYEKNITPDMLIKQFDLHYPLSKAPPQPSRNCKWRDKLSNQRNNKPKKKKSDFSQKPQSNLENINTMFQSFQINSSESSQLRNEFTGQNSRSTNYSFPPQVNFNKTTIKDEMNIFSNEIGTTGGTEVSSPYKNGETANKAYFEESDTNKLFDNLVINSNSFLKSLSDYSKISQDSIKAPQQTNGAYSRKTFHKGKDSFDFMAETRKLLDALNKPSPSHDQTEDVIANKVNLESPKTNMSRNEEIETLQHSQQYSNSFSELHPIIDLANESNLSSKEKTNVGHDMINSIIDKAVGLDDSKSSNWIHSSITHETVNKTCGRGLSWDYVVVNSDNTFSYQRKNSIPFGFPVVISDDMGSSNVNVTNNTIPVKKPNHQLETNDDNVEVVLSDDVYESDGGTIGNKLCDIICKANREDDSPFLNNLDTSDSCRDKKISQFDSPDQSQCHPKSNSEVSVNSENFFTKPSYKEFEGDKSTNAGNNDNNNPNMFEMMKDILCTLAPLHNNSNSLSTRNGSSNREADTSKNSEFDRMPQGAENENLTTNSIKVPLSDPLASWNQVCDSTDVSAIEKSQPKPARNLRRPKLLTNAAEHQFNDNDFSKYFGNWNIVSNPAESWEMEKAVDDRSGSKNEISALPQRSIPPRCKNIKKMTDSSTNTNYLDFTLANEENVTGVKILMGNINNSFSENIPDVKQNIAGFLDKSTMTVEDLIKPLRSYDVTQITHLFPDIPEKYILEIVEKCRGDIDWAVDVLLDSEHNIAPISIESDDDSDSSNGDVAEPAVNLLEIDHTKKSSKREPRSPTHEQTELKKLLESSVVFDRSHYSDKVLKVVKRKHPEYVQLVVKSPALNEGVGKSENSDTSQDGCKTEDEVDEVEEESSSSGCEVETEDDTMDLFMSNDFILQLQQKFGSSSLPKVAEMTPIVKLPVSFARQLFGYIMDSLQSDMDQQQALIEDMISRDEEVARLLQFQDQASRPQLQEVMDMEIALAMHKADQEEWNAKTHEETLAAKLSKNILLEKFPHVDPKMLKEVLQAHNFSLSDTINALTLGLGVEAVPDTATEKAPQELPKQEKEWVTTVIVSDDIGASASAASNANPVTEAAAHRAQAASYYSLRIECLSKAHDAFRSGNKAVASYYSQLAQMHKEGMDQSNSKAAACLFSSHKTGANTLDLHFLHIREAEVVLDMFLDEVVNYISERNKRHQMVFLITGRGLRSVGGVSRIKPMVQRKLKGRGIRYNEVNPGMLSALVRSVTPLSYTL